MSFLKGKIVTKTFFLKGKKLHKKILLKWENCHKNVLLQGKVSQDPSEQVRTESVGGQKVGQEALPTLALSEAQLSCVRLDERGRPPAILS